MKTCKRVLGTLLVFAACSFVFVMAYMYFETEWEASKNVALQFQEGLGSQPVAYLEHPATTDKTFQFLIHAGRLYETPGRQNPMSGCRECHQYAAAVHHGIQSQRGVAEGVP